jgi:hypothetical protein
MIYKMLVGTEQHDGERPQATNCLKLRSLNLYIFENKVYGEALGI